MLEVAQGMEYIHSEGVVHGDLRGVCLIPIYIVEMLTFFFSGECPPGCRSPRSNRRFRID